MGLFYVNGDCGSGKTLALLKWIASHPGLYVVALNKIELFGEHQATLDAYAGAKPIKVFAINSKDGVHKASVGERITKQIQDINKLNLPNCVVFITHEALFRVDWLRSDLEAHRWRLFIDESPSPWSYIERRFEVSWDCVHQFIAPHPDANHNDYIPVQLTDKGEALRQSRHDPLKEVLNDYLNATRLGKYAYANRSFFNSDGNQSTTLSLFSIIDPQVLAEFGEATILSANFKETFAHLIWSKMGVNFMPHPDLVVSRSRSVPLGNRIRIHYFSDREASLNWFNSDANPLKVAGEWLNKNVEVPHYYAVNHSKVGGRRFNQINNHLALQIDPIAMGSNKLNEMTAAAWLVSLKGKPHEYTIIKELFGITREQFDRARELEPLYQFALRSNLRDFESTIPVDIYVVSKVQADFLKSITGAQHCEWVGIELPEPVKAIDHNPKPAGRPKKYKSSDDAKDAQRNRDREYRQKKRIQQRQLLQKEAA